MDWIGLDWIGLDWIGLDWDDSCDSDPLILISFSSESEKKRESRRRSSFSFPASFDQTLIQDDHHPSRKGIV